MSRALFWVFEGLAFAKVPVTHYLERITYADDTLHAAANVPHALDADAFYQALCTHVVGRSLKQLAKARGVNADAHPDVAIIRLDLTLSRAKPRPAPNWRLGHIVAVTSGKGGVGKSTTAVNLALALKAQGARVGLLDGDAYGPSVCHMLGAQGGRATFDAGRLVPCDIRGLAVLSMDMLMPQDAPLGLRGIKASGALLKLYDADWGKLDYLIVDMPPGTGDIHLSLGARIPFTGALVVTTPQDVARLDVARGVGLCNKMGIPVLGVVENMTHHICPNCGHKSHIFGQGAADTLAQSHHLPILGRLPLSASICLDMDAGCPSVLGTDAVANAYLDLGRKTAALCASLAPKSTRFY